MEASKMAPSSSSSTSSSGVVIVLAALTVASLRNDALLGIVIVVIVFIIIIIRIALRYRRTNVANFAPPPPPLGVVVPNSVGMPPVGAGRSYPRPEASHSSGRLAAAAKSQRQCAQRNLTCIRLHRGVPFTGPAVHTLLHLGACTDILRPALHKRRVRTLRRPGGWPGDRPAAAGRFPGPALSGYSVADPPYACRPLPAALQLAAVFPFLPLLGIRRVHGLSGIRAVAAPPGGTAPNAEPAAAAEPRPCNALAAPNSSQAHLPD
ncbi:hypothetical protein DFJ73DRAFT_801474 [Zopfochytrium polystomum]|nr:hypothetical protein DFJ73DRAFT_801474 [Zopfochytrium polystomum]